MLYREAGQFKASYSEDQQIFPIRQDRIMVALLLLVAYVAVPLIASEYWLSTDRLRRTAESGHRRLYGDGCLCRL